MNDPLGLQQTLAVVLGGSLMCVAGAGLAYDMGNMMNPSQGAGGNSWGGPGYGYRGPGPYAGPYGSAGQAPYGLNPYSTIPHGSGPGGYPAGHAPAPVAPVPAPSQDQASRIRDLERRIGELEAYKRRQKMLHPPLRPFDSAYGPHGP